LLPVLPIGLSAALALAAPVPAPGGDTVAIRVEFDAPVGCSNVDAFYSGLLARMNRARRAGPTEDAVRLGVRLTRVGNKVRGELRLMEGPGDSDTRRVEGESCDAVVEVLSLTAALALAAQPARATPPPPPPPPPRPPPPPPTRAPPPPPEAPKPPESPPPNEAPKPPEPPKPPDVEKTTVTIQPPPPPGHVQTRFQIGLQAVAADIMSNTVNAGGAFATRIQRDTDGHPGASVGLTILYAPNDFLQTADHFTLHWTALAVTACPPFSLGRTVTLQACAQAMGGWLSASGLGITYPNSVVRSWWSAGALLRVGAHLGGGFALELEGGVTIPLVERDFFITTPEMTVGGTPTVAPIVTLGLSRAL
jgi:hypothetical protein